MVVRRHLTLDPDARAELVACRDHDAHPQMRERAAALLKIADGMAPYQVARSGLLKPRDPDSVYGWLTAYERGGLVEVRAHLHGRHPRGRLRRSGASDPGAGDLVSWAGGSG